MESLKPFRESVSGRFFRLAWREKVESGIVTTVISQSGRMCSTIEEANRKL
ncbi:hypothetical protein LCM20_09095 [Halobacillus litoralis]|uniref:hypothetical protein n=1 Tax=Halobacillus litoralis TaxID=45668 RepID=UPI001CD5F876|nr:hypothetical protein [Halobacillus litoralis]MCA0970743.1 hypothetical protein [Halobacillus litoralis]